MPVASSSRKPSTRKPASRSRAAQTSASQLADQLATTLTLSDAKGKHKATPQLSQEEQRLQAMKMVNSTSQHLSTLVQSGWRRSHEKGPQKSSALTEANEAATNAAKHLAILRKMSVGGLDIERAGMSILGKLVALEMYDAALPALQISHSRIRTLLGQQGTLQSSSDQFQLISLPLPSPEPIDVVMLTLVSTYLVNAVSILSHTCFIQSSRSSKTSRDDAFALFSDALKNRPTLLSWIEHFSSLPKKHNDSLLTRTYSVLTKLASTTKTVNPGDVLSVRLYAVQCLAHTSPGTVEKPDTFWDQVNRVIAAYIKVPEATEQESTSKMMSSLTILIAVCERRSDAKTFMSGDGFMAFCECWIALANRVGDIQTLDKIAVLMHDSSSSSSSSSVSKSASSRSDEGDDTPVSAERVTNTKDLIVQGTALYGTLAQVTTTLDQPLESSALTRLKEATNTIKKSPVSVFLSNLSNDTDKNFQRVAGKVDRALERVRRGVVKVLDVQQRPPDNLRVALCDLLEVIVGIYEATIRTNPNPDFFTQVLDALFVLARTGLVIADPRTYTPAYDHLARALCILEVKDSDEATTETRSNILDRANYVRCTSGAFHNIAGTLYQAGRYGSTISFLKQGCRLGVMALELRRQTSTCCTEDLTKATQEDDSRKAVWKQLEEQLWRRWQLLGVCYIKIGDRRPAFDSLLSCVKTFPYAANSFGLQADKLGFKSLFDLSPAVKELAGVIERITYLGACELLLPPKSITLRSIGLEDCSVVGALLEKQIDSLENSWWKQGVCEVAVSLMKDAIEVYRCGVMPLRASRVFLRSLSLAYYLGPERVTALGTTDDIGTEANNMLSSELGRDTYLASYRYEYQASIHLWLGLHAHRRSDSKQSALISEHADEACRLLRSFMTPPKSEASPKATSKSSTVKKAEMKKASATSRTAKASKSRSKVPVTPKPKGRSVLQDIPTNAPTPTISHANPKNVLPTLDNVPSLLEVLHLTSHVLGLLALVFPKIQILALSRWLSEKFIGSTTDDFVISSSELAYEYFKLGKTRRANRLFEQALASTRSGQVSEEVACSLLLKYSASCALNAEVPQSIKLYSEGRILASGFIEDKHGSNTQRLQARVARIERTATAFQVLGSILHSQNDASASLSNLLQSFRLWTRAFESLARLHPQTPKHSRPSKDETNPFEVSSLRDALPADTPSQVQLEQPRKSFMRRHSMNGLEWRISQGLLDILFSLSRVYLKRGSPREAQYFTQQARDLAEALNAPAFICRAITKNGELQMHQGKLEEGYAEVLDLDGLVHDNAGADMADIYRLRGDLEQRGAKVDGAQHHYEAAARILENFDQTFVSQDGVDFGPRKSVGNDQVVDVLLPELLAQVLGRHIWLLRNETGEKFMQMLSKFMALPPTPDIQATKEGLAAKLAFHDVYRRSRVDMFLSSIGETTVALPMGTSTDLTTSMSPASLEIMKSLENAERHFWTHLATIGHNGYSPDIRESALAIALIRAFQASMGRCDASGPSLLVGLLDASSAVTLRREMIEAIDNKFRASIKDKLQWPSHSTSDSPLPVMQKLQQLTLSDSGSDDDRDDDEDKDKCNLQETSLKQYWMAVKHRYETHGLDAETLPPSSMSELPPNWTVVHITVTEDKNTMFISRQRGGNLNKDQPLIFCVPLKGRREGPEDDDNEHLTFEDALNEMNEIIQLSNATTKVAASIRDDQSARAKWWKERGALDTRLRELLENIEFCWLGAFKTILSKNPRLSPETISNLRIQFDRVFKTGLRLQDKKTKERALGHGKAPSESWTPNRVTLDDTLIECFSTLSPQCRDEEIEDLVYFILDLYQFHGVPVAIAEVDVDQVVIDLRAVLEEHWSKTKTGSRTGHGHIGAFGYSGGENDDEHLFLVLDKNVQGLPWESIPVLRGRSVSRIPSISFLLDRVRFARLKQQDIGVGTRTVDRACVDPRKGYYIMNPSGDLNRTESRFRNWLNEMEEVGWQGISGRPPSELQVLQALQTKDLVVYFGHGGAEQYVRSHRIRHLPQCAAVMLWGCSSGTLRDMGDFDRVGTPWNYMLAGCPTLVANLWDVTDKDIDTFSQAVFDKLHMTADCIRDWRPSSLSEASTSLVKAVAESRDSCKLKYLTGAAPVVYGIPFYL